MEKKVYDENVDLSAWAKQKMSDVAIPKKKKKCFLSMECENQR